MCLNNCWVSGKQCHISSGSTLFAKAILSQYLGQLQNTKSKSNSGKTAIFVKILSSFTFSQLKVKYMQTVQALTRPDLGRSITVTFDIHTNINFFMLLIMLTKQWKNHIIHWPMSTYLVSYNIKKKQKNRKKAYLWQHSGIAREELFICIARKSFENLSLISLP